MRRKPFVTLLAGLWITITAWSQIVPTYATKAEVSAIQRTNAAKLNITNGVGYGTTITNAKFYITGNTLPQGYYIATDEQDISSRNPANATTLLATGDSTSGLWVWDSSNTSSDQTGIVSVNGYATGRWKRLIGTSASVALNGSRATVTDSAKRIVESSATKQQVDKTQAQFATVLALAANTGTTTDWPDGLVVTVGGYYTNGDGGGGLYRANSSAALPGLFVTTAGGVKFEAIFNDGRCNILRFGAIGDGVTDSTASIQAANDYVKSLYGGVVFVPEGVFVAANLSLGIRVILEGTGTVFSDTYSTSKASLAYGASGRSILKLKSASNTNLITVDATGGYLRQTGTTEDGIVVNKYIHGGAIVGMVLDGNASNQTRYDCDLVRMKYLWNFTIENCAVQNQRGYAVWIRDCNVIHIRKCTGAGNNTAAKGIFGWSLGDSKILDNDIGGVTGPLLWGTAEYSWVNLVEHNLFFNQLRSRFQISGISGNVITTTSAHVYETGSPVEIQTDTGGTTPTGVTNGVAYWAIKLSATTLSLATSYESALSNVVSSVSGGAGTNYVFHGYPSGVYLSGGAKQWDIVGNRFDQNQGHGVALFDAHRILLVDNIIEKNQYDTALDTADTIPAAAVALLGGSTDNVIQGNDLSTTFPSVYGQSYGVLEAGSGNARNYIGVNTYTNNVLANVFVTTPSSVSIIDWRLATNAVMAYNGLYQVQANQQGVAAAGTSVATIDATNVNLTKPHGVPGAITNTTSITAGTSINGATLAVGSAASGTVAAFTGGAAGAAVVTYARSGQPTVGIKASAGMMFSDETSAKVLGRFSWQSPNIELTLGSTGTAAPGPVYLHGEAGLGTDVAGAGFSFATGWGTGAGSITSAIFKFFTPTVGSPGATAQTLAEQFRISSGTSAGAVPIWVNYNGTLKQVEVGAADSGGAGYRILRITN